MLSRQKVLTNYLITVFLFLFVITSASNADDLTVTYAYSLYSGSESVAFSPDGKYIATGDIDGDVGFWEVGDDDVIDYVDLGGEVRGVAFSPNGNYLAADGNDGNVTVWLLDVATRTTVRGTYVHDDADNINSIAYSPDGRYVAVGMDIVWAFLWDLNSGAVNGWGKLDASEVYDVAFSPDGRYLATGNDNGDLTLWELNSWWTDDANTIDFKPGGNVRSVAFSPDGRYLAADGYDGSSTYVNIYNVGTRRVAWQINSGNVYAIAFSPNGEYIALGDTDGVITFYRIGTNPTHVAEITASGEVLDLAWSPDGTLISDGRDVWNVNKPLAPIAEATENKIYWADSSDGKIRRSNLDGSTVEVVLSGLGSPQEIALDISGSKVYWIEKGSGKIRRANLNGTAVEDLLVGLDDPVYFALDVSGGKMYWVERGSDKIRRANLNGTAVEDLVTSGLDLDGGIALDTTNGKMYWTNWYTGDIRRANLNGTAVEDLLTGLNNPTGIALDVSGGKMYWVEQGSDKIRRANLNGTNVEDLVTSGLDRPYEIALDLIHGKMYWTDWATDRIQRANLDGSGVENLVIGLDHPLGMALDLSHSVLSNTIVNLGSSPVESPTVGELFTLPLNIIRGENVAGYQATVQFDTTALKYVRSANGDYLPDGAFFIPPVVDGNSVTLAASSFAGASNGDGTLATITFEVLAVKTSTLTLSDVLLTDSAGGSSRPQVETTQITESSPLTNGIGLAFPPDLISEVAFAPNSTYFIVTAKQTMLTNVAGANILYGSCIFTLHIPDNMQGFVFPIKTKEEQADDAGVNLILKLGFNLIPLGGTFLDALDLFSKVNDLQNRDLKIELNSSTQYTEPSEAEFEFIVLLKHPENAKPDGIDITIEQQYRDTDRGSTRIDKVVKTKRWIFDDGWAAPAAQVTFFDYPPFQLLPAEVQQYLLLQFSEFGTTGSGLMPKETALLANYPNPFNPETWIPYQLAAPTDVSISIYAADGTLVRTLDVGHHSGGIYQSKNRAAYWDGRNTLGEPVASGVYFYTLTAGEFSATRKMLIRK